MSRCLEQCFTSLFNAVLLNWVRIFYRRWVWNIAAITCKRWEQFIFFITISICYARAFVFCSDAACAHFNNFLHFEHQFGFVTSLVLLLGGEQLWIPWRKKLCKCSSHALQRRSIIWRCLQSILRAHKMENIT